MPSLPQELIELIIDEVATWWHKPAERLATLQSCTLVCKDWLSRSSAHLFYRITRIDVDMSRELRAMRDLPRLRASVVHFVVSYAPIPLSTYCDTLRVFERLERLEFRSSGAVDVDTLDIEWPYPESTGRTLKLLELNSLPSATNVLPRILGLFTRVRGLVLSECYVAEQTDHERAPCVVENLSVIDCREEGLHGVPYIVNPVELSSIRIDLGKYGTIDAPLLDNFLRNLGGNLTHLTYTHSPVGWASPAQGEDANSLYLPRELKFLAQSTFLPFPPAATYALSQFITVDLPWVPTTNFTSTIFCPFSMLCRCSSVT